MIVNVLGAIGGLVAVLLCCWLVLTLTAPLEAEIRRLRAENERKAATLSKARAERGRPAELLETGVDSNGDQYWLFANGGAHNWDSSYGNDPCTGSRCRDL